MRRSPPPALDPARKDLVERFRRNPAGPHDGEVLRMLSVLRGEPLRDKYVLVTTEPHREWVLGQLSGVRGGPVKLFEEHRFTSIEAAEWAVFKLRWKRHTGEDLD